METVLQDLRYAFRILRRDAAFSCFAILIISLGIGASSTVFSVLDTLLVRPLPFKDPASLIWIANRTRTEGDLSGATVQVGRLLDLRERNTSFSDIAGYFAFYGVGDSKLSGNGEPERLSAVPVSQNFFPLLGISPQIGQQFSAEQCKWNGPKAALLSYGLWQRRFGSDPAIAGKTIRLDDAEVTVAGVLPASFDFAGVFAPGTHIDLFVPFPLTKETDRWGNTLALIGRLKPGTGIGRAQSEADILGARMTAENPHNNGLDPKLTFLSQHVSGHVRPALYVLAGAVGVVMLIVCANLSNMLLARTATRQREMAIRTALGAGRKRLIRQLLTESTLLTGAGALLGLLIALLSTRALAHLDAFSIPLLSSVHVDGIALGFTVLAAIMTGLVLGTAPALQAAAIPLAASLGQRGASEGRRHNWTRGVLVVSEIAFACLLLVCAGLLIRSFVHVLEVDPGFRPESAAAWRIDPNSQYKTQAQQNAYFDEVLRRVRTIPAVQAAGITDVLPLGHNRSWGSAAKGQVYKDGEYPSAFVRIVSDGYLKAMGMVLKQGRDFSPRDAVTGSKPVIMINESLANRLWPGQDPIGQFIVGDCGVDRQVVGVVGNVRHVALEQGSGFEMYMPIRQCQDWGSTDLVVRSTLPLAVLAATIDAALRPMIPDLPRGGMRPLTGLVDRAVSPRRFIVMLLTGFAIFALVLASLGIYGVISYSVARRTQEIGIRMALGASTGGVQARIVLQTLGLTAVGLLIGAVASSLLARALSGLLFGVTSGDAATFLAAAGILTFIALLAGYLPARKASRIDPMIALRAD